MNRKMKKVIVSHPGRQHSHRLAYALQEGNMLLKYFTGFWYKPHKFPCNILKKIQKFEKEFRKRYFEKINPELVSQNPFPEIKHRFILKSKNRDLKIGREFDRWVAGKIKNMDFDVFIGYELSSLESFTVCRKKGKITILDLAQIHYKEIKKLNESYKFLNIDSSTLQFMESVKEEELKNSDYIITLSTFAKESLVKNGIPENKIFVLNLGVDTEKFKRKENYINDKFVVLFVSSITKRKGLVYLIKAFKEIKKDDMELIVIGPSADDFEAVKKNKNILNYIPFLHHEELLKFYHKASIFVFPSVLDSFGQVVLEAMSCGLPVIITENVGAKDCVREGIDGFVIPAGDISALKEKILYFYNNRDKIEEMGKNAAERAKEYTWEKYGERVREVIKKVTGEK